MSDKIFSTYLSAVAKSVGFKTPLSLEAKTMLSEVLCRWIHECVAQAVVLVRHEKKKTITSREMQAVARTLFSGDLVISAVSCGVRAVTRYASYATSNEEKATKAARSGTVLPPSRVENCIRHDLVTMGHGDMRVGETAPVYLTGVLECLLVEIFKCVPRDVKKLTVERLLEMPEVRKVLSV
jgi:histone H2B